MLKLSAVAVAIVLAAAPASAALIGISSATSSLYSIDAATGAATLIGPTGGSASLSGLSFADGTLYGTDVFSVSNGPMVTLDTTTGAATGFSDQDGSINWHGLASTAGGLMFTIDIDDGNRLKSITTAGVITTIGTGAGISGLGMAYDDGNGILFATDGDDSLHTVDTATGTSSLIGFTGIPSSGYIGLAYDEVNDILFANGGADDSLYRLDVATGAATLIGANGVAFIDGLAWLDTGVPPIPVPATLPLLAGAIAAMGLWRRRASA